MTDPTQPDSYFTFREHGEGITKGDILDGEDAVLAVRDQRLLVISDMLFDDTVLLADLVSGDTDCRFLTVVPAGGPLTEVSHQSQTWWEAPEWHVTGEAPLAGFIGPQAAEVVEAVKLAVEHLHGDGEESPEAGRYYELATSTYEAMQTARKGALAAMETLRADFWWWDAGAFSCAFGEEIIAIAARDLIGTAPGWTAEAHDLLTAPYRAAFGETAPGAAQLAT